MSNDNISITETIATQYHNWLDGLSAQRTGPLSVSLLTQKAKAVYAETLLAATGSSDDVFARLQSALS